jgi:uncharacterized protein YqkB
MLSMVKKSGIPEALLAQYDLIVSKIPEIERKGKSSPYTSMNGNMYTMLRKDGVLGIRLSEEDRKTFMETFDAIPFENYGSMIKEYVEVPETVFMDDSVIIEYMNKSHEYAKTLKLKSTKKSLENSKTFTEKALVKKVTHDVGKSFKNGQIKSEIIGNQLTNYYEDGSVRAQGKVRNEKMEGRWIFNRKGGQLWQIGHFHEDVKNGEWIRYDSKGVVSYHVVFEKGKVVEKLY